MFRTELLPEAKRIGALCFLRLLCEDGRQKVDDPSLWRKVFQLFDLELSRDIYPLLRLEPKDQTFEKENKLVQGVIALKSELRDIIGSFSTLQVLSGFKQRLLQRVNNHVSKALLWPFLPFDRPDLKVLELFSLVENYLAETGLRTLQAYEQAVSSLEEFCSECDTHGTTYSRMFMGGCGTKLKTLLQQHFSESAYSKAANLIVEAVEKKYPFSAVGNTCDIGLIVRNIGPGHAFEVHLEIDEITDVRLDRKFVYLGHLEPGAQIIELPVEILTKTEFCCVSGKIKWINFDKSENFHDFILQLNGQRADINWSSLALDDPYALDAIANEAELIGRKDILDQLFVQAQGKTVGSSLILGQKRVGKTSIVKTLANRLTHSPDGSTKVIYLEGGDYVDPEPLVTIANLGRMLCEEIRRADPKFHAIQIPQFENAIAPLSSFLSEVSLLAPDFRILIILDEFDELPIDLYRRGAVGDAFFLTLRSISNKAPYGFLLVGSEKMDFIFSFQGERLNKFQSRPVDYFDKAKHWSDFSDLVRRPVAGCLEYSDDAITTLYAQSAGNPYFTKQICRELYHMMVERRDSHITQKEVHEATARALNTRLYRT